MSKLFILGAGFSKAISKDMQTGCIMPTMKELGKHVKSRIREFPGNSEIYERLLSDPNNVEDLLTYLYEAGPWKSADEIYLHKSAFLVLSNIIADHISELEQEVFQAEPPEWAREFIQYVHQKNFTVATFNYDTILERLSVMYIRQEDNQRIDIEDLYQAPISNLATRTGSWYLGVSYQKTYRLIKLHGSINWYFSGDENIPRQEVYYSDVFRIDGPSRPGVQRYIHSVERNKKDLIPLIIPPVAGKTPFYSIQLVRVQWQMLRSAIEEADEIYCAGYSLPRTDHTARMFFSTVTNSKAKKIHIVNLKKGSDNLISNYRQAWGNCELIADYLSDGNPIEQMVRPKFRTN